jgi:hypothetical protein
VNESSHQVYCNFNGDDKADLAIGVFSEDVIVSAKIVTFSDAGAVTVQSRSSNSLPATSTLTDQ